MQMQQHWIHMWNLPKLHKSASRVHTRMCIFLLPEQQKCCTRLTQPVSFLVLKLCLQLPMSKGRLRGEGTRGCPLFPFPSAAPFQWSDQPAQGPDASKKGRWGLLVMRASFCVWSRLVLVGAEALGAVSAPAYSGVALLNLHTWWFPQNSVLREHDKGYPECEWGTPLLSTSAGVGAPSQFHTKQHFRDKRQQPQGLIKRRALPSTAFLSDCPWGGACSGRWGEARFNLGVMWPGCHFRMIVVPADWRIGCPGEK